MIRTIFFLSCLLAGTSVSAQNFLHAYTDHSALAYVGFRNDIISDGFQNLINATSYSGTIEVGSQSYPANGSLSAVLIKRDPLGNLIWSRSLSSGQMTLISGLYCDSLNNIYVLGFFGDTIAPSLLNTNPFPISNGPGIRVFIAKYSPSGQVLWTNSIPCSTSGSSGNADHFAIAGDGSGMLVITAPFRNVPPQQVGPSLVSPQAGSVLMAWIDSNGNWIGAGLLPGIGNTYFEIVPGMNSVGETYLTTTFRGSMALGSAGFFSTPPGELRDVLIKYDTSRNPVWAHMLDASSWWGSRIRVLPDGVLLAGSFGGALQIGSTTLNAGYHSSYMTKLDHAGNFLWAKKYGESETQVYALATAGSDIYLVGRTSNPSDTNVFDGIHLDYNDAWGTQYPSACYVLKTDASGNALSAGYARFSFPTLNVMDACVSASGLHITGNVGSGAVFGGVLIDAVQLNGVNYVAHFSDSANGVKGSSFYDFNSNGNFDASDQPASVNLQINGPLSSINTLVNGDFLLGVGTGTYTIAVSNPPPYYTVAQPSYTSVFGSLSMQVDSNRNFAFQPIPGQVDLEVDLVASAMRPGFSVLLWATLKNIGTTVESGVLQILLQHPEISIDSVSLNAGILGDTVFYTYSLLPQQQVQVLVYASLSAQAIPGSLVACSANAANANDLTPTNNLYQTERMVTASYDPNDKLVLPEGPITPSFVSNGDELEYTIRFQNTGTDTAFTVLIADTISPLLDLASFEFIGASHPVAISRNGNLTWFRFNQILLPDSNTNEPLSHGYLRYRIKALPTASVGNIIKNTAYIYFDFNAPIVTNTTHTLIETPLGSDQHWTAKAFSMYPNPWQSGSITLCEADGMQMIEVFDQSGRLALSQSLQSNTLNLPENLLAPGSYTVRLSGKDRTAVAPLKVIR